MTAPKNGSVGVGMTAPENGSASIVMIAVSLLVLSAALVAAGAVSMVDAAHRARTGADLAALSAAAHAGAGTETACAWARATATANGTTLLECRVDAGEATVAVTADPAVPVPGLAAPTVEARAGPIRPESPTPGPKDSPSRRATVQ